MIVVLLGYMGSGKSTVGRDLSKVLNYDFIDLDDYICEIESLSATEIFNTKGEIYFRKKESQYLEDLLNLKDNLVLSLGGGTPCYGKNLELILKNKLTTSIYLKASIKEITKRLSLQKLQRPLINHLNSYNEFSEFIGKHLFERAPYYEKADEIILVDDKPVKNIIEEIVLRLI